MINLGRVARYFVSLVCSSFLVPAFAQTAGVLEEVVVTAERREASLQNVPLAVSALSMEQLESLQITEAQDLQRYVPSLNMFGNVTQPTNLSLSLRGGVIQDASLVVAESPVGIYIDDIYVGRLNGNNVTLSDIERVEVLRGPQGTLYGRNTSYGAIKFVSRTPGDETWFDGTAGIGNDEQVLFSASVGGPFSDGWAGSLSARWYEKDEQYFNVAENTDTGNQENLSLRGKLRFTGIDNFDAQLSILFSDSENDSLQSVNGITPNVLGGCDEFPAGVCGPGETAQFTTDDLVFPNGEFATNTTWGQLQPPPLTDKPQADTDQTIVGLTLSYDLSDTMTLRSITGYVGTEDLWHTDFSGNSAAQPAFTGADTSDSDQFTQELQLLGSAMDSRLNYIAGVFYLHEEADQTFGWHFVSPLSQSFINTEIDSISIFGEASYQLTDRLKATAGLRWTDDEKDFTFDFERFAGNFFNIIIPGAFPPSVEQIRLEGDYDEWTPRFVLDYALDPVGAIDSMLLYAQAAKGFKGGGFSAISLITTEAVGVYEPETNWTYEGGLKAEWFGNRLRTNLAYFFADITDVQQNSTAASGPGLEFPVQNSGDAEIQGLEFEISAVPLDGLNVFLSGALLDGEYENLNPLSSAAQAPDEFGVQPETPQTPDYAINIGFDYTFDAPGNLIGDVAFGADYYEIDNYITSATNDFVNSGWDLWNAFVSAEVGENWLVKVTGKNLADDFIVTSGSRGLGGFIALPPREYLFSVTYRYGQ